MKTLIKTTAVLGGTEVILAIVNGIRNKYLAVTVGPEGFGIYGLLNSFFQLLAVFSSGWIILGTTKYISEYYRTGNRDEMNKTFTFAIITVVGIGVIATALLILNYDGILRNLISRDVPKYYYFLFTATFLWMSINPVFYSILQGLVKVHWVVSCKLLSAAINLIVTFVLVFFFFMVGYFVSLLLSTLLTTIVLFWYIWRSGVRLTNLCLKDYAVKNMLAFGGVNLSLAFVNLGSQYLQRIIIIQQTNIASVGILQAGVSIMAYIGLVSQSSSFYFFPKMSEQIGNEERVSRINEYIIFVLFISISICAGATLFGYLAIRVLYSYEFMSLVSALMWFVLAQFLSNIGNAYQFALVGASRLGMHTMSVVAIHLLYVLVPLCVMEKYGMASIGMGFVAGQLVGILLNVWYLWRRIGLRPSRRSVYMFLLGIGGIVVSGAYVGESVFFRGGLLGIILLVTLCFLREDERAEMIGLLRSWRSHMNL